jgi:hypothetical protein
MQKIMMALFFVLVPVMLKAGNIQLASIQRYESSGQLTAAVEKTADVPDGIDAATCSLMGAVPVIVEGPTKLEFWWRGSDSGVITLYVNGHPQAVVVRDEGWKKFSYTITEAGVHSIKWIFTRNS